MTSDFLVDLDAAIEQRCACLCGQPITGASPSAYFASERCSDRWHRPTGDPPVDLAAVARLLRDFLRAAFDAFRRAMQEIGRALIRVAEQLAKAAGPPPLLPASLPPLPRPPARLDPPGGLRASALGRPQYRPAR